MSSVKEGDNMGILDILKISASALKAERTRMEITSSNLANLYTQRVQMKVGLTKRKKLSSLLQMFQKDRDLAECCPIGSTV